MAFWRLFPHSAFKRKPIEKLHEDKGKLQEENRETTGGLQEETKRNFCCFEGVRVGEKGG